MARGLFLAGVSVAKRFEDLLVWQRMNGLSAEIWKATERLPATTSSFATRSVDLRRKTRALLRKGAAL
jgi:hypothetical protein